MSWRVRCGSTLIAPGSGGQLRLVWSHPFVLAAALALVALVPLSALLRIADWTASAATTRRERRALRRWV
jgi:hypothetical protein